MTDDEFDAMQAEYDLCGVDGRLRDFAEAVRAAERERCAKLRSLLQGAEVLFAPLCRDATAWNWLDEARAALAETAGPNAIAEPDPTARGNT